MPPLPSPSVKRNRQGTTILSVANCVEEASCEAGGARQRSKVSPLTCSNDRYLSRTHWAFAIAASTGKPMDTVGGDPLSLLTPDNVLRRRSSCGFVRESRRGRTGACDQPTSARDERVPSEDGVRDTARQYPGGVSSGRVSYPNTVRRMQLTGEIANTRRRHARSMALHCS